MSWIVQLHTFVHSVVIRCLMTDVSSVVKSDSVKWCPGGWGSDRFQGRVGCIYLPVTR